MLRCDLCDKPATHILVDYRHEIVGNGELFCEHHAFIDEREKCPCCYDYTIQFNPPKGGRVKLLPTYPDGTLDHEGCCSEHP